ncbi:hypothetical protein R3P38DRAFT_2923607 [Favolaschia claudopus]|uniref:Uncharacterized protein n=1 Tax=Favolaschia claudopus TaxID=2862362 RepID=A0AAW0BX34_9AGAR
MTTSYSTFYTSGLQPHASADIDHENAPSLLHRRPCILPPAISTRPQSPRSPTRKRRSSLTSAVSPISSLKSPARAAGNAWHIANVAANSPRSRSGTYLVGMRSGSLGNRLRGRRPLTNQRPVALLFAPTPPAPTVPLPALPLGAPARPPLSRLEIQPALAPALPIADVFYAKPPFYHAPGVWKGFSSIDEEDMKEN